MSPASSRLNLTSTSLVRRRLLGAAFALPLLGAFGAFRPVRAADPRRVLVVCYSHTGTTEALARAAAEALGGDFHKLELLEPYSTNYSEMTAAARVEKETGALRELKGPVPDASGYDLIVVASPVWSEELATPAKTYLVTEARAGHLKGKPVATLHTAFSSGAEGSRAQAEQLAPDARFVGEPFIALGSGARTHTNEAQAWARKLLEEGL